MVIPSDRAFTMALSSVSISSDIPASISLFTGTAKINAITIQADCDMTFQFQKTDGTALSGTIHLPKYDTYSQAVQGDGFLYSAGGIKLVITGCPTGRINGFATQHA